MAVPKTPSFPLSASEPNLTPPLTRVPPPEHNEALDKIEAASTGKKWDPGSGVIGRGINAIKTKLAQTGKEHKQVLKELSIDLIDKYIAREGRKAKKQKEEEHKKMRIIAAR